jgi:GLPGLI family protein
MKKIFFLIVALLNFFSFFAQSGSVIYSIKISADSFDATGEIKERIIKSIEYANNHKFELIFSKNQSSFKFIENMKKNDGFDDFEEKIAKLGMTTGCEFYFDHQNNINLRKESDGQLTEMLYSKINWELTSDSKTIDNHLCYKAIVREPKKNRIGEDVEVVYTAWFAPDLPYSYGPKQYFGLPGLILELLDNKTTFYASKIELSDKEIKINFPKGKTITKEEYDNKLKSQMGM